MSGPRTMPRAVLGALPVLGFGALALGLAMSLDRRAPAPAPLAEIAARPAGAARPDGPRDWALPAFELPGLAGAQSGLSSADLGGRVALVNVFASWCGPCRAEHPLLLEIATGKPGVPIYGINWRDAEGGGALFLKRLGNPYRGVGVDRAGALGAALGIAAIPQTLVVDRRGRVRYVQVGRITPEIWRTVLKPLIDELGQET